VVGAKFTRARMVDGVDGVYREVLAGA
jgi:hypothetical protein